MSHLQRPQGLRTGILAASLTMAVGMAFSPHAQPPLDPAMEKDILATLQNAQIKMDSSKVGDFGNWNDCLDYKISAGMYWCKGSFLFVPTPPYPSPCVDFEYREPTAVIEVTCSGKSNVKGTFSIASIFVGSNKSEAQQNCVANIKTKDGQYSRAFNHTIVRSATGPASRLAMNSTPLQVAQSYTCGVLGVAGNMDMIANLQNFDFSQMFDTSSWSAALGQTAQQLQASAASFNLNSMFTDIGNAITGAFDAIATGISDAATNFASMLQNVAPQLEASLQSLMTGAESILSGEQFNQIAQNFKEIGDAMGAAGAVGGDGNLLNAAIGATSAGNALATLAQGGFSPEQGASLAQSVQTALNLGLQSFGSAPQTASKDTFYATHFTPANFAQSTDGTVAATALAGAQMPKSEGYASWSFVPVVTKGKDGKLTATGFLKDGQSQVALNSMLMSISTTMGWVDGMSKVASGEGLNTILGGNAASLCSFQNQIRGAIGVVKNLGDKVASTTSPTQFLPYGTYLNATQPQVVLATSPVASCPLTHAGFRARLDNPSKLEMVNCTSVCTGGGDEPRVCRIVPKSGFAGSCFSNALSVQKEEGFYPACNGQKPERVADGKGGWRNGGGQYDATLDHHTKINDIYRNRVLQVQAPALARLQEVDRQLTAKIQSLGGACTALGNPVGTEFIAYQPLPGSSQSAATAATGTPEVAGANLAGGFATMTASADQLITIASVGADNLVASQVARLDPGILTLPVVYNSNNNPKGGGVIDTWAENAPTSTASSWETGQFRMESFINNTFAQLGNNSIGGLTELAGCSSKLITDMVIDRTQATSTACWGDLADRDGWSWAKIEPLQKATIAARGLRVGQELDAIPEDTSGKGPVFNTESTGDRQEATTQGLPAIGSKAGQKAKNSKCYAEGSMNPGWYTPNDAIVPAEEMFGALKGNFDWAGSKTDTDDGSMVFTYWKNTKCCIPPTCPQNIHQIY